MTAIAAGQPIAVTSYSLRGLPEAVAELVPAADDPEAMRRDILRLLGDPAEARARRSQVERAAKTLRSENGYGAAIDLARAAPSDAAEARRSLVAAFGPEPPSSPPDLSFERRAAKLTFNMAGNAAAFIAAGWHEPEVWGRWMDGDCATLRLAASSVSSRTKVHVQFCDFQRPVGVSVSCGGRVLTPLGLTTAAGSARFEIDDSMKDPGHGTITLEFRTDSTTCPRDIDGSADARVLGAGIEWVTFTREADSLRSGEITLSFSDKGNAEPYIGEGWYKPEPWGRWMHGAWATLRFPASWFDRPARVEIRFCEHRGLVPVSVAFRSRVLTPHGATTESGSVQVVIDPALRDSSDETVTIELQALTTVCPRDLGWNQERRILGAGVESVTITSIGEGREAVAAADPYAAWCLATFGEEIPKPGVRHAAKFRDDAIWSQKAHDALLGVELDYVASLLRDIRDANVPGALVEFGIFRGWWINKLFELSERVGLHRTIIGFDSFVGLSASRSNYDGDFWTDGQHAASQDIVADCVKLAERDRIQLIPGVFADSLTRGPATSVGPIAYARIDCDAYEPTWDCLRYLAPRLSHGAVLAFDEWPHALDTGEGRAFYEWAFTVPSLRFEFLAFCAGGHFYIRVWRRL